MLHGDVETEIKSAGKLTPLAALALFGDKERGGDVMAHLNNKFGRRAGDTFKGCNDGAHKGLDGDLQLSSSPTRNGWLAACWS